MKTKLSYAIGDVVLYKGKERVIFAADINSDSTMEYSISIDGAWFTHKELEFVRDADRESLLVVVKEFYEN